MVFLVIFAVLFILFGFVLGFFLTSRVANKNQGQMKHCQSCQYLKAWNPYNNYSDDPDFIYENMLDEERLEFDKNSKKEG